MVKLFCKLCLQPVSATEWKSHIAQKQHLQQLPVKIVVKGSFKQNEVAKVYEYFAKFGGIRGQNVTNKGDEVSVEYRFWDARVYSEIIHQEHSLFDNEVEISWYRKPKGAPLQYVVQDEKMLREKFTYRKLAILNSLKELETFDEQLTLLQNKLELVKAQMDSNREVVRNDLATVLSPHFPHSQIHFFGSSITGLHIHDSDLNIYIDNTDSELSTLENVKNLISKSRLFSQICLNPETETPTITCEHTKSKVSCELNIKNELPVGNSELIKFYLTLDEKLRHLMLLVKFWFDCCGLREELGFSSYAIYLMVLFYLQQEPYKLPSVADLQKDAPPDEVDGWNCAFGPVEFANSKLEKATIFELVLGFFIFYSNFDYISKIISPYFGSPIEKTCFLKPYELPDCFQDYLYQDKVFVVKSGICVQDVFEHSKNVSLSCDLPCMGKFTAVCRNSLELVRSNAKESLFKLLLALEDNLHEFSVRNEDICDPHEWIFRIRSHVMTILTQICSCDVEEKFVDTSVMYSCTGSFNIFDKRLETLKSLIIQSSLDVSGISSINKEVAVTTHLRKSSQNVPWKMVVVLKFDLDPCRVRIIFTDEENVSSILQHFVYVKLVEALNNMEIRVASTPVNEEKFHVGETLECLVKNERPFDIVEPSADKLQELTQNENSSTVDAPLQNPILPDEDILECLVIGETQVTEESRKTDRDISLVDEKKQHVEGLLNIETKAGEGTDCDAMIARLDSDTQTEGSVQEIQQSGENQGVEQTNDSEKVGLEDSTVEKHLFTEEIISNIEAQNVNIEETVCSSAVKDTQNQNALIVDASAEDEEAQLIRILHETESLTSNRNIEMMDVDEEQNRASEEVQQVDEKQLEEEYLVFNVGPPIERYNLDFARLKDDVTNSEMSVLSFNDQLTIFLDKVQVDAQNIEKTCALIHHDVTAVLSSVYPQSEVHFYDDVAIGLDLGDAFLKMYVSKLMEDCSQRIALLNSIEQLLTRCEKFDEVSVCKKRGKVGVRCLHTKTAVTCALYLTDKVEWRMSNLLRYYLSLDSKIRTLILLVKFWMKCYDFHWSVTNNAHLLVIFYLQQEPFKLPSVFELQKNASDESTPGWNFAFAPVEFASVALQSATVFELLRGFFKFYAEFDYIDYVICPFMGFALEKIKFVKPFDLPEAYIKYMNQNNPFAIRAYSVQEPFVHSKSLWSTSTDDQQLNNFTVLCSTSSLLFSHEEKLLRRLFLTALTSSDIHTFYLHKPDEEDCIEWRRFVKNVLFITFAEIFHCHVHVDVKDSEEWSLSAEADFSVLENRLTVLKGRPDLGSDVCELEREISIGLHCAKDRPETKSPWKTHLEVTFLPNPWRVKLTSDGEGCVHVENFLRTRLTKFVAEKHKTEEFLRKRCFVEEAEERSSGLESILPLDTMNQLKTGLTFSDQVKILYDSLLPNRPEVHAKDLLIANRLALILKKRFPDSTVHPYGSRTLNLDLPTSTYDIFVDLGTTRFYKGLYNQVTDVLSIDAIFTNISCNENSIQCVHVDTNTVCELHIQDRIRLKTTDLIAYYCSIDEKIPMLMVMIKLWALRNNLMNKNGFSSYSLYLMVIFYLQRNAQVPRVRVLIDKPNDPSRCNFQPVGFESTLNDASMSELVRGFFHFYSEFSYVAYVVAPFYGHGLRKCQFLRPYRLPRCYYRYMKTQEDLDVTSGFCVQDPFAHHRNVTRETSLETAGRFTALCRAAVKEDYDDVIPLFVGQNSKIFGTFQIVKNCGETNIAWRKFVEAQTLLRLQKIQGCVLNETFTSLDVTRFFLLQPVDVWSNRMGILNSVIVSDTFEKERLTTEHILKNQVPLTFTAIEVELEFSKNPVRVDFTVKGSHDKAHFVHVVYTNLKFVVDKFPAVDETTILSAYSHEGTENYSIVKQVISKVQEPSTFTEQMFILSKLLERPNPETRVTKVQDDLVECQQFKKIVCLGSTIFNLPMSPVTFYIDFKARGPISEKKTLELLASVLAANKKFAEFEVVFEEIRHVLSCVHVDTKLACILTLTLEFPTRPLECYLNLDEKIWQLSNFVTLWAERYPHSDPILPPHALYLLVIFYLQQEPYNLPSLQTVQKSTPDLDHTTFDSSIFTSPTLQQASIFDLVRGFFKFYSEFDYFTQVVSVFHGVRKEKWQLLDLATDPYGKLPNNDLIVDMQPWLCIQDPLQAEQRSQNILSQHGHLSSAKFTTRCRHSLLLMDKGEDKLLSELLQNQDLELPSFEFVNQTGIAHDHWTKIVLEMFQQIATELLHFSTENWESSEGVFTLLCRARFDVPAVLTFKGCLKHLLPKDAPWEADKVIFSMILDRNCVEEMDFHLTFADGPSRLILTAATMNEVQFHYLHIIYTRLIKFWPEEETSTRLLGDPENFDAFLQCLQKSATFTDQLSILGKNLEIYQSEKKEQYSLVTGDLSAVLASDFPKISFDFSDVGVASYSLSRPDLLRICFDGIDVNNMTLHLMEDLISDNNVFRNVSILEQLDSVIQGEHVATQVKFELTVKDNLILRTNHFIKLYMSCDRRIAVALTVIKFWVDLVENKFTNNCVPLMVIFYLQVVHKLPAMAVLLSTSTGEFMSINSLGELKDATVFDLVIGFFRFYDSFDYVSYVISPYFGSLVEKTRLLKPYDLQQYPRYTNQNKELPVGSGIDVQHPLQLFKNVTAHLTQEDLGLFIARCRHALHSLQDESLSFIWKYKECDLESVEFTFANVSMPLEAMKSALVKLLKDVIGSSDEFSENQTPGTLFSWDCKGQKNVWDCRVYAAKRLLLSPRISNVDREVAITKAVNKQFFQLVDPWELQIDLLQEKSCDGLTMRITKGSAAFRNFVGHFLYVHLLKVINEKLVVAEEDSVEGPDFLTNKLKTASTLSIQTAIIRNSLAVDENDSVVKSELIEHDLKLALKGPNIVKKITFSFRLLSSDAFNIYLEIGHLQGQTDTQLWEILKIGIFQSEHFSDVVIMSQSIRCTHTKTQTICELSMSDNVLEARSELLKYYSTLDDKVASLMYFVKFWADSNQLTGAHGFSNDSIYMMVVFFLQVNYRLPNVKKLQNGVRASIVGGWNCAFGRPNFSACDIRSSTIRDLASRFFSFYGSFDYISQVISPYLGQPIAKSLFLEPQKLVQSFGRYKRKREILAFDAGICVQDFFDHARNVCSAPLYLCGKFARLCRFSGQLIDDSEENFFGRSIDQRIFFTVCGENFKDAQETIDQGKEIFEKVFGCSITPCSQLDVALNYQCRIPYDVWTNRIHILKDTKRHSSVFDREAAVTAEVVKRGPQGLETTFLISIKSCYKAIEVRFDTRDFPLMDHLIHFLYVNFFKSLKAKVREGVDATLPMSETAMSGLFEESSQGEIENTATEKDDIIVLDEYCEDDPDVEIIETFNEIIEIPDSPRSSSVDNSDYTETTVTLEKEMQDSANDCLSKPNTPTPAAITSTTFEDSIIAHLRRKKAPTFTDQVSQLIECIKTDECTLNENLDEIKNHLKTSLKLTNFCFYGSSTTGLHIRDSDVNVHVGVMPRAISHKFHFASTQFQDVVTKDPTDIRCVHVPTKLRLALTTRSHISVRTSELIKYFLSLNEKSRHLVTTVKYWARCVRLSRATSLTSHMIELMVIFYLQVRYKLPSVAQLQKNSSCVFVNNWNCGFDSAVTASLPNTATIPNLVKGFFKFYADFDYFSLVVAPFFGAAIAKTRFIQPFTVPEEYSTYVRRRKELVVDDGMCIQCPFEHSRNVASSVSYAAAAEFAFLCRKVVARMELSVEDMLADVLAVLHQDGLSWELQKPANLVFDKWVESLKCLTLEVLIKVMGGTVSQRCVGANTVEYTSEGPYTVLSNRVRTTRNISKTLRRDTSFFDKESTVTKHILQGSSVTSPKLWKLDVQISTEESASKLSFSFNGPVDVCNFVYSRIAKSLQSSAQSVKKIGEPAKAREPEEIDSSSKRNVEENRSDKPDTNDVTSTERNNQATTDAMEHKETSKSLFSVNGTEETENVTTIVESNPAVSSNKADVESSNKPDRNFRNEDQLSQSESTNATVLNENKRTTQSVPSEEASDVSADKLDGPGNESIEASNIPANASSFEEIQDSSDNLSSKNFTNDDRVIPTSVECTNEISDKEIRQSVSPENKVERASDDSTERTELMEASKEGIDNLQSTSVSIDGDQYSGSLLKSNSQMAEASDASQSVPLNEKETFGNSASRSDIDGEPADLSKIEDTSASVENMRIRETVSSTKKLEEACNDSTTQPDVIANEAKSSSNEEKQISQSLSSEEDHITVVPDEIRMESSITVTNVRSTESRPMKRKIDDSGGSERKKVRTEEPQVSKCDNSVQKHVSCDIDHLESSTQVTDVNENETVQSSEQVFSELQGDALSGDKNETPDKQTGIISTQKNELERVSVQLVAYELSPTSSEDNNQEIMVSSEIQRSDTVVNDPELTTAESLSPEKQPVADSSHNNKPDEVSVRLFASEEETKIVSSPPSSGICSLESTALKSTNEATMSEASPAKEETAGASSESQIEESKQTFEDENKSEQKDESASLNAVVRSGDGESSIGNNIVKETPNTSSSSNAGCKNVETVEKSQVVSSSSSEIRQPESKKVTVQAPSTSSSSNGHLKCVEPSTSFDTTRKTLTILESTKDRSTFTAQTSHFCKNMLLPQKTVKANQDLINRDLKIAMSTQLRSTLFIGSSSFGLSTADSQFDIYVDTLLTHRNLKDYLVLSRKFYEIITHHNDHVVECRHKETKIRCRLHVNNTRAVYNSRLIEYYLSLDNKLPQLLFLLSSWAEATDLKKLSISSHALHLLVIFYLQQKPYGLPSVSELQKGVVPKIVDGWNCAIAPREVHSRALKDATMRELVFGFFRFYSTFDYFTYVIAPFAGSAINKVCFVRPFDLPPCYRNLVERSEFMLMEFGLWVQDAFEHTRNVAAAVTLPAMGRWAALCRQASGLARGGDRHLLHGLLGRRGAADGGAEVAMGAAREPEQWLEAARSVLFGVLTDVLCCEVLQVRGTGTVGAVDEVEVACRGAREVWGGRVHILKLWMEKVPPGSTCFGVDKFVSKLIKSGESRSGGFDLTVRMTIVREPVSVRVAVDGEEMWHYTHFIYTRMMAALEVDGLGALPVNAVISKPYKILVKGKFQCVEMAQIKAHFSKFGKITEAKMVDKNLAVEYSFANCDDYFKVIQEEHTVLEQKLKIVPLAPLNSKIPNDRPKKIFSTASIHKILLPHQHTPPAANFKNWQLAIIHDLVDGATFDQQVDALWDRVTNSSGSPAKKKRFIIKNNFSCALFSKFSNSKIRFAGDLVDLDLDSVELNVDDVSTSNEAATLRTMKELICASDNFADVAIASDVNGNFISCKHVKAKLRCRLRVRHKLALSRSELLKYYLTFDSKLPKFMLLLKFWAECHDLVDVGGFSENALYLMAIFYLQQEPYKLPAVKDLQDSGTSKNIYAWNTAYVEVAAFSSPPLKTATLRDLFVGFLKFYSLFDYVTYVVSPYFGSPLGKVRFLKPYHLPKSFGILQKHDKDLAVNSSVCVQDFFDHSLNHSSSVRLDFMGRFTNLCRTSLQLISPDEHLLLYKLLTNAQSFFIQNPEFIVDKNDDIDDKKWVQLVKSTTLKVLSEVLDYKLAAMPIFGVGRTSFDCTGQHNVWKKRVQATKMVSGSELTGIDGDIAITKKVIAQCPKKVTWRVFVDLTFVKFPSRVKVVSVRKKECFNVYHVCHFLYTRLMEALGQGGVGECPDGVEMETSSSALEIPAQVTIQPSTSEEANIAKNNVKPLATSDISDDEIPFDETDREVTKTATQLRKRKRKLSESGEIEDDVPSDFFDDFSNEDFLDDIVNVDDSDHCDKPEKKTQKALKHKDKTKRASKEEKKVSKEHSTRQKNLSSSPSRSGKSEQSKTRLQCRRTYRRRRSSSGSSGGKAKKVRSRSGSGHRIRSVGSRDRRSRSRSRSDSGTGRFCSRPRRRFSSRTRRSRSGSSDRSRCPHGKGKRSRRSRSSSGDSTRSISPHSLRKKMKARKKFLLEEIRQKLNKVKPILPSLSDSATTVQRSPTSSMSIPVLPTSSTVVPSVPAVPSGSPSPVDLPDERDERTTEDSRKLFAKGKESVGDGLVSAVEQEASVKPADARDFHNKVKVISRCEDLMNFLRPESRPITRSTVTSSRPLRLQQKYRSPLQKMRVTFRFTSPKNQPVDVYSAALDEVLKKAGVVKNSFETDLVDVVAQALVQSPVLDKETVTRVLKETLLGMLDNTLSVGTQRAEGSTGGVQVGKPGGSNCNDI